MEINKNTKLENRQTNRWLVGTMWRYAWQPLNNLRTFFGWGLTKLGDGCKSLFSRATTTTKTVDSTTDHVSGKLSADKNDTSVLFNDKSLDKLSKENDEGITKLESFINDSTFYKKDLLGLKRKSTESSRNERGNGTIQSTRHNVHKNSRIGDSTKGINFDKEESHKEINIKEENYEPLPTLGLNFSFADSQQAYSLEESQQTAHFGEFHTGGIHIEDIEIKVIKPILKNSNGRRPKREISNKRVGFNRKVAVLLFDEEQSPAETQNKVKSFKDIDFSDKGREENKKMIRKSSYEVADEFKSFKGSDLKKSFIQIGGKVIKKSK